MEKHFDKKFKKNAEKLNNSLFFYKNNYSVCIIWAMTWGVLGLLIFVPAALCYSHLCWIGFGLCLFLMVISLIYVSIYFDKLGDYLEKTFLAQGYGSAYLDLLLD